MTELNDILDKVYQLGYDRGWQHRGDEVPFFGYGTAEPSRETHLPDPEKWAAELYGNLDLSNIAYVQFKHAMPLSEDRTWSDLKYIPHLDEKSDMEARSWLHEQLNFGSIAQGKTVNHIERDPAEFASRLREQMREQEEVNEALRATHPNGDIEDGEWELDSYDVLGGEATVPLNGDHVFDRAVIEFDTEAYSNRGEPGEVNVKVDIESVKLVSNN